MKKGTSYGGKDTFETELREIAEENTAMLASDLTPNALSKKNQSQEKDMKNDIRQIARLNRRKS